MPSYEHDGLVRLFHNRPELAPALLRDALGIELPAYSKASVESADLTDLEPATRHADLVVLLADGKPVLGIVIEVQLAPDPKKRRSWPAYVIGLSARFKCPACVLVVAVSESVARWARKPIEVGPGNVFHALVVGPSSVPVIDDVSAAVTDPEMAVLSALAHGDGPRAEAIGRAAVLAALRVANESQVLYCDLVLKAVSQAARAALEKLMSSGEYEFQSEYFQKLVAKTQARSRVEGRVEGHAQSILRVLTARGVRVPDAVRARILACTDDAQLDAWLDKAATATSIEQVL